MAAEITNSSLVFHRGNAKKWEWIGSILGASGSLLVALNVTISGYGFLFYLSSNVFLIMFGLQTRSYGIVFQQLVFMITSSIGIARWLL